MNRFEYLESSLAENETVVAKEKYTKLYHGHEKTNFHNGDLVLTTHRLFWGSHDEFEKGSVQLCLCLSYIQSIATEESGSFVFAKKKRIICNLHEASPEKLPGPADNSNSVIDFIKISSKPGLSETFIRCFKETVQIKSWLIALNKSDGKQVRSIKLRTGIVGIERSIISKQQETDESISKAFEDLNVLMKMAQNMVKISKTISGKIKERNSDISEDETIKFRTYLMSLGIEDPVTRSNFQSNSDYYTHLAKEITEVLLDIIDESYGMITLPEAYCRINRARCLEMLSVEDFLNACKFLQGPLRLRKFQSGTAVLTMESNNDESIAKTIEDKLSSQEYLTIEKYADDSKISLLLAKERIIVAESLGKLCRDSSVEGFRFYPNKFLME